jgi:radical SAM protein with 4Fe4S-binding SPASM domain
MSLTVVWQLTRECDLGCNDCATAQARARTHELTTYESYKTIDQIASAKPQRFVISGGDPLARRDIPEIVQYARRRGLEPAVNVSPTRSLTAESINALRRNGLMRLIFSINGSNPQRHDAMTGVEGSFANTVRGLRWGHDTGVVIEINTLVTRNNVSDLAAIAEMIDAFRIDAWNVHFIVPVTKKRKEQMLTAGQTEAAFSALSAIAGLAKYRIRVVEAPHYRRHLMQETNTDQAAWSDFAGYVGNSEVVDDLVFISADGEVHPSEFLPLSGGNLREHPLKEIVRSSDLFVSLRDRSNLTGKCRSCEYKNACGGSRARAWAMTGDLFASDPLCAYQPLAPEVDA